jgi:hypothetical protein
MTYKPDKNQRDMMDSESVLSKEDSTEARLNEGLSALMDGESSELEFRRLLNELPQRPALADSWRRYHVVRDTLNGEIHSKPAVNLLAGIHARMQAEGDVTPPVREKQYFSRFLRLAGQGAIAASVAVMVLTGVTFIEMTDQQPEGAATVARQDNIPELGGDYTPSEFSRVVRMNDAARSRLQQAVYQFSTSPGAAGLSGEGNFDLQGLEPFEPLQEASDLQENQATTE